MNRILLVDGNANDRSWVKERLEAAGNEIVCASDATAAIDQLERRRFDMLLTEWMLRDMSGLELSHYVRRHANGHFIRILMLSERSHASAVAQALDNGIDDYLSKPVSAEELLARVNAAFRRPAAPSPESVLQIGPIRLDRMGHKVTAAGRELDLSPVEFRLISFFMENPGRVLARRQLLEQVWRRRDGIGERTVDVHVRRLRAALEPHACEGLLQTVRGFGYRFG